MIDKLTEENPPRTVRFWWSNDHYHIIFYGTLGAAQIALLLPVRADSGHHGLHHAGIHRFPLIETRRAEPRMDRSGQRDGPPAGHADLVASGMDRIPAFAGRGSGSRRGDEQGPHAPDEDRGPLLENRLRDAPHAGQYQRDRGRIGHVFPQTHSRATLRSTTTDWPSLRCRPTSTPHCSNGSSKT